MTFVTRLAICERVWRTIGSSAVCATTVCCTGTGLVTLVILDLVRSAIGLASGCGCLSIRRGDTLVPWFGTLGGDALCVGSRKSIGKAMLGISSLGVFLSATRVSSARYWLFLRWFDEVLWDRHLIGKFGHSRPSAFCDWSVLWLRLPNGRLW